MNGQTGPVKMEFQNEGHYGRLNWTVKMNGQDGRSKWTTNTILAQTFSFSSSIFSCSSMAEKKINSIPSF